MVCFACLLFLVASILAICFSVLRIFHPCLQDSLTEVEEKYKKAMVSNAQLDNDKGNLIYHVDTLKDVIEEMEEQMAELRRENEDKSKVLLSHYLTLFTCVTLDYKT